MEYAIFYKEWQSLPTPEYKVLAMIAERGGVFTGTYADMCRYFSVTVQQRNRNVFRNSIHNLSVDGWINETSQGNTQILKIIPKEKEIKIPLELARSIINHEYASEPVSFVNVLKVYLWIVAKGKEEIVTNKMIADELGVSPSTVVSAKNVLEREYHNIKKERVSVKICEDHYKTLGQILEASAFWD